MRNVLGPNNFTYFTQFDLGGRQVATEQEKAVVLSFLELLK